MKRLLILLTGVVLLTSCMTQQKAVNYLSKKELLPQVCADSFPVVPKVEVVVRERKVADTALLDSLARTNDRLLARLHYLQSLPPKVDSAQCEELRMLYKADLAYYTDKVRRLEQRERNRKVTDTIRIETTPDSAAIKALTIQNNKLAERAAQAEKDRDTWKAKARRRAGNFWISAGTNALLIFLLGFLFTRKKRP